MPRAKVSNITNVQEINLFIKFSLKDSAAQAIFGTQIEKLKKEGKEPDEAIKIEMDKVRETYDRELDAKHAAARGLLDAIVTPENLRDSLIVALETCLNTDKPHIGAFVLPTTL